MSAEEQNQRHAEDEQQRRNREVIELLNELRVALPGGAGALRLPAYRALLSRVLFRNPTAAVCVLRHTAVHGDFRGAAHRAFFPPPPPVAPARQGGEAQGSQPPEYRGV